MGIFVVKNGKFLISCRKGTHGVNTWGLLGGHLEFGETIEEGAKREVLEETGMLIKNVKIVGITNDIIENGEKHYVTIWITSKWESGEPEITEPDKFLRLEWRDFDTLPENLFLPLSGLLRSDLVKKIKRTLK